MTPTIDFDGMAYLTITRSILEPVWNNLTFVARLSSLSVWKGYAKPYIAVGIGYLKINGMN